MPEARGDSVKAAIDTLPGKTDNVWRNRIVGEGVEAPDQLLANPQNWRTHPKFQQANGNG